MTFWSYTKNGFIRKIRLISQFMTSQPVKQLIAIFNQAVFIHDQKGKTKI